MDAAFGPNQKKALSPARLTALLFCGVLLAPGKLVYLPLAALLLLVPAARLGHHARAKKCAYLAACLALALLLNTGLLTDTLRSGQTAVQTTHVAALGGHAVGAEAAGVGHGRLGERGDYGLSESTGPGCVHLGIENIDKVGAIGIPGYRWSCKIVDENGNALPQGEVGELCVQGPGMMTCYYNDPKATAETIKDGWLFTGDMAMQDEDGFYFLVDRKKDVIVSGGENIYPVQIENFLSAFDKVKDVAVIGLPDKRLGEITGAVISIKDGMECTEEEINEYCMKLPRYKRPKKLIFADVPRNATGKIEKPALRKKYGAEYLVAQQNRA